MALLGGVFAAEETGSVERFGAIFLNNLPVFQYPSIYLHILFPSYLMLVPLVKEIFSRCKIDNVFVGDVANLVGEKLQVLAFGKTRQLATIADAHIDELFHAVVAYQTEETLGTFLRETYGV